MGRLAAPGAEKANSQTEEELTEEVARPRPFAPHDGAKSVRIVNHGQPLLRPSAPWRTVNVMAGGRLSNWRATMRHLAAFAMGAAGHHRGPTTRTRRPSSDREGGGGK